MPITLPTNQPPTPQDLADLHAQVDAYIAVNAPQQTVTELYEIVAAQQFMLAQLLPPVPEPG